MALTKESLLSVAETRLEDATVLLGKTRYHGAVYMSGYVIELVLKAKIVAVNSFGFPETKLEKKDSYSVLGTNIKGHDLWTHDLTELANFAGVDTTDKNDSDNGYWDQVLPWNSEMRYQNNPVDATNAEAILEAVNHLWNKLK